MKKFVQIILVITLILLLITAAIWGAVTYQNRVKQQKAEHLYGNIQTILKEYPDLPDSYGYTKLYYQDGTYEYMLFRNGEKQITARRDANGETVYYTEGKTWSLDSDGKLTETGIAADPVENIVREAVDALLAEKEITYSYHLAAGIPLPKWVYEGEEYLRCHREKHPEFLMEVMVQDEEDYGEYVHWNIIGPDETVVLFLFACPYMDAPNSAGEDVLFGWDMLEGEVYGAVFENP